jgi:uncharacterized protein YndB with AHSA1/START domain/class 3 adenylate cyclase
MPTVTEHGYLVLADITGYTSYLAGVELEHAHEILTDLLEVIVERFKLMLTISKLEGDAVFANVSDAQLPRPEALLELTEGTYLAFRMRRDSAQRRTTCTCRACQSIPMLDLKFFVHHGSYIVQDISGIRELVGSDINMIHRLTKNHISESTGWRAYTLFTQDALAGMDLKLDGIHEQVEAYEHLGEIKTFSIDMQPRYSKLIEAQRVVISPEEADLILTHEFEAPLPLVWQLITDPKILTQTFREDGHWDAIIRPGGRAGAGAQNHCAHGKGVMVYDYLDWRPFQYFTARAEEGGQTHWEMFMVDAGSDANHTSLTVRLKLSTPFPKWVNHIMVTRIAKQSFLEFFGRSQELLNHLDATGQKVPAVESAAT